MPHKPNAAQDIDQPIEEWKQDLLDEASALVLADVEALRADIADFRRAQDELSAREEKLKKYMEQTSRAAEKTTAAVDLFTFQVAWNYMLSGLVGGAIGGLVMFLFMWYIW